MRALVIDDSRATRSLIGKMMKSLGFDVLGAGNGKEALETLEAEGEVDVMLVDWNMPVMNGYEFLLSARADSRYASIPIMMVTTEAEMAQVMKAIQAGANEYVMKPFTKEVIEEKMNILGVTH